MINVEEITGHHALDELGYNFDELVGDLGTPLTTRRPWRSARVAAYPEYKPWAVIAWDSGRLVGACLFAHRRVAQALEVIALGQGRNDRTGLLTSNSDVTEALAGRITETLERLQQSWTLHIAQLPVYGRVASALLQKMPNSVLGVGGSIPSVDFCNERSADAHLSANLPRQLQKCRNRLATDHLTPTIAFDREPWTQSAATRRWSRLM